MSGTKPLIFVHPLSDSLKKLKEVIAETADEDGVEIYEVDDVMEVSQLLPSIGQSLTIFSNPKKCAAVLQPNRRAIQKLNTKVILLSAKAIPRKTLDKFSKIGLTECIVEPVPPKTLLYKVKLLLRSIVVSGDEEEDESGEKKFSHSEDENSDSQQKQRLEKGILTDNENVIDYNLRGKLGTDLALDADDSDDEEKENGYKESSIETEWQGKVNNTSIDIEDEEDKDKEGSEASYLDAYLRGKKKDTEEVVLDLENEAKDKKYHNDEDEDDYSSNRKRDQSLALEAENKNNKNSDKTEKNTDDKFYKGKLNSSMLDMKFDEDDKSNMQDEEETSSAEQRKKTPTDFGLDIDSDSDDSHANDFESEDEEEKSKRKNHEEAFNLETEEDSRKTNAANEILLEKENKEKEESHDDQERDERSREARAEGLNLGLEDDENNEDERNENEIDNYIRGTLAKTVTLIDEEEIDARNGNSIDEDEDEEKDNTHLDLEKGFKLDSDEEDENESRETKLNLDRDQNKEKEDLFDDDDQDQLKNRNSTTLSLDGSDEKDSEKEEHELDDDDAYGKHRRDKDLSLAFDHDNDDKEKAAREESDKDYSRKKSGIDLDLEQDTDLKKYSAHTDKIETNLDSRKGIKHQDYDWDINKKKDGSENYGQEKKAKSQLDISFKEKVDLGEQTIDYRKLKSEFEAITINRSASGKKSDGPTYYSENKDKEFLRGIYSDDYLETLTDAEVTALKNKVDQQEDTIFTPKSNGLEVAIQVLNLYENKNIQKEEVFKFIDQAIFEKFQGISVFYILNRTKNEFEVVYQDKEKISETYIKKESAVKAQWDVLNLPNWENEKFNTDENLFFFPIYEGANKLGYITCYFENKPQQEISKTIEVVLETTRGLFLEFFHKEGITGEYTKNKETTDTKQKENEGVVKSFFGKLFKKAS